MHSNVINFIPSVQSLRSARANKARQIARQVASLWQPAPQRIAIFRALQLGDMLCSIPALRALRAAAPHARIVLVGLPSARVILERYPHYIDELVLFPGVPEFPEQPADVEALPAFFEAMRARNFDLAIQLHGSGSIANDIVRKFGAKLTAGFKPDEQDTDDVRDGCFMRWPEQLPEVHRYIEMMKFIGARSAGDHLELPLHEADWSEWTNLAREHGLEEGRYVCLHVGARLPSRRWPLERFAEVAAYFIGRGKTIVLTGATEERPLVDALRPILEADIRNRGNAVGNDDVNPHIVDLCGRTTLGGLAALIASSQLLVCNDTGVSHVAAAVGARSVVIASGSDVTRWAPLDRERHRVLAHHVPCRPCSHHECPTDHACARGVSPAMVIEQTEHLMGEMHAA
ncbi:MAG: biosynthesis glycosyltransferase [Rhodocyclales bacterium]|nr:biosynthesis glycosyltransferase [Rhodocyclales bacterium]